MMAGRMFRRSISLLAMAALFLALPKSLWANLAVVSVSDIQRTGNLVALQKSEIELVSEDFTATLNAETAQVTVDYEFVNTAGDDDVTVGFPVDLMPPAGDDRTYHLEYWPRDGLQDLRIVDGKTELEIERSVEEDLPAENPTETTEGHRYHPALVDYDPSF